MYGKRVGKRVGKRLGRKVGQKVGERFGKSADNRIRKKVEEKVNVGCEHQEGKSEPKLGTCSERSDAACGKLLAITWRRRVNQF
jgi:hypothetical protein